jgi:hypothetical protein
MYVLVGARCVSVLRVTLGFCISSFGSHLVSLVIMTSSRSSVDMEYLSGSKTSKYTAVWGKPRESRKFDSSPLFKKYVTDHESRI